MIYDDHNVGVWLIDFAKTYPVPPEIVVNHRRPWVQGNHEEGLLYGLDQFISVSINSFDRYRVRYDTIRYDTTRSIIKSISFWKKKKIWRKGKERKGRGEGEREGKGGKT